MKSVNYLSVCSGIESATVAWHPLGWEPWAFAEIEPFPSAVLAHHYPAVPNLGDMTKFEEWPDATVDLLVGGTPCQSFSVAGLRKGLADPRGNLMLTYGAAAARYRPRWLVWENVPGVLSSNKGRDFGAFLGMLGELGYGFAYRVLDAQYVRVDGFARAVPQRRRRVFVVGHLGDWRRAAAVLFERESLRGDPAPRRKAGSGSACGTLRSTDGGSDLEHGRAGQLVAGTLKSNNGGGGFGSDQFETFIPVADTRNARVGVVAETLTGHPGGFRHDYDSETFVAHSLRGEGFDASEGGTGRGTPLVPVAYPINEVHAGWNSNGLGIGENNDPAPTIQAGKQHGVAYSTKLHNTQSNQAGKLYAEYTVGLDRNSPPPALVSTMAIRRLTPRECERLQGFPDDFTLIPVRGKPAADGPRYKALGNSMAVNVMRWIGQRIAMVEAIPTAGERAA